MRGLSQQRAGQSVRRRKAGRRAAEDSVVTAFQHFVGEIFRLNGQLLATAESISRSINVTPARWQTIATLRHGPLTVAQIARQLGLRRQSVQYNVNLLVEQGLAELLPNPSHRRASLVGLTRQGQAVMKELYRLQAELTTRFVGDLPLTSPDIEAMTTLLQGIRRQGEQDPAGNSPDSAG